MAQALLSEGTWPCTVLHGTDGETDKGSPQVQITVRIDEGPSAGRVCTYEDQINAKSALYVGRSMKAVGWAGRTVKTLKADIDAWLAKTDGKSTVEIRHIPFVDKKTGEPRIWDKPNSIGRGAQALKPMSPVRLSDADEALRSAMAADGGAPPADDDVPHAGANDDTPFVSCSAREPSCIAKVLR